MPTEVHIVKPMVYPVVICECKNWTIKKTESWRTDSFKLWYWRRLLRIPWIARRLKQSILKEINPKYSLEELMLKLKLQYFGHLMQRANSLEKKKKKQCWERLRTGGEGDNRGWHHWLNGHEFEQTIREIVKDREAWVLQSMKLQRVGHNLAAEQQHHLMSKWFA